MYGRLSEVKGLGVPDRDQAPKAAAPDLTQVRVRHIVLSWEFALLFLVCALKITTGFLMGVMFKEFGLHFGFDDVTITKIGLAASSVSLISRFYMGKVVEWLTLRGAHALNLLIEMLVVTILYFFGDSLALYCVYAVLNRVSQGECPRCSSLPNSRDVFEHQLRGLPQDLGACDRIGAGQVLRRDVLFGKFIRHFADGCVSRK